MQRVSSEETALIIKVRTLHRQKQSWRGRWMCSLQEMHGILDGNAWSDTWNHPPDSGSVDDIDNKNQKTNNIICKL